MITQYKKCLAFAAMACAALSPAGAVEWSLTVEKNGATNVVTAAGNPFAIDVSLAEIGGGWSGRIVNREKGAIVLGFEVRPIRRRSLRESPRSTSRMYTGGESATGLCTA